MHAQRESADIGVAANSHFEKNIAARRAKGFGIIQQIISILNYVIFGGFDFEVFTVPNSILTNAEIWYNLSAGDIRNLESSGNRSIHP